jgi:hypothetical protein
MGDKISMTINFSIAALGFAFSVVNAIYLSNVDKNCQGYNSQERKFLFVVSIVLAIFFGLLTMTSVYGISVAFSK